MTSRLFIRISLLIGTLYSSTAFAQETNETAEASIQNVTILQSLASGGSIMYVLLILSILTLALVMHAFSTVRSHSLIPVSFVDDATTLIKRGDFPRAEAIAETARHLGSDLLQAAVGHRKSPQPKVEDAIANAGGRAISRIHQRITYLSNIGAIAPMLGLLGTVVGLIQAFNTIASLDEGAKALVLAGDIRKAMVTTAGGLLVGIPAMGFYFFFKGRLTQITSDLEVAGEHIAAAVDESRP